MASVFSPLPIETPGRGKRVTLASWCGAREPALLAVAVEGGTVLVLDEDGSLHDEVVKGKVSAHYDPEAGIGKRSEAVCTCLAWSDNQLQGGNVLLACGWSDGTVMVWSEKDRMQRSDDENTAGSQSPLCASRPTARGCSRATGGR